MSNITLPPKPTTQNALQSDIRPSFTIPEDQYQAQEDREHIFTPFPWTYTIQGKGGKPSDTNLIVSHNGEAEYLMANTTKFNRGNINKLNVDRNRNADLTGLFPPPSLLDVYKPKKLEYIRGWWD